MTPRGRENSDERTRTRRGALAVGRAVAVSVLLALAARPVAAHQVASRFEAPIPLELLFLGAAAAVGLTALVLALLDEPPTPRLRVGSVPPSIGRPLALCARAAFFLAFLGVLAAGVLGPRAAAENFATLFAWPLWLKGVAVVSVFAGSPWRTLSPWRTIYDALCRLEGGEIRLRSYPDAAGHWPALVSFVLLVGVAENLTQIPRFPAATAAVFAVYALVALVGAVVFGRTWFERADAFEVLYDLLGRVAPLSVKAREGEGWTVELRAPWRDCSTPLATRTQTAFVVAMVYTVTFDGFAESPVYRSVYFGVREAFGVGPTVGVVLYEVGLVGFLLAYLGVVVAVERLGRIARTRGDADEGTPGAGAEPDGGRADAGGEALAPATLAFGGTLVPIAAGYELAHNYGFVATYLGKLPAVAGFHSVDLLWWLSLPMFWIAQVAFVVAGHVVAVVAADAVVKRRLAARRTAADDADVAREPTKRRALVSHAPLVALMVGYTVLSLWVISLPVAT
jgi:hypothetical protein